MWLNSPGSEETSANRRQFVLYRVTHRLASRPDSDLDQHVVDVLVGSPRCDAELVSDGTVRQSSGDESQNVALPAAQVAGPATTVAGAPGEGAEQTPLDRHRTERDGADRREQLAGGSALEQVPRRTRLQRFSGELRISRQHEDLNLRMGYSKPSGGLDSVHASHPDVHEHDVGEELGHQFERRL